MAVNIEATRARLGPLVKKILGEEWRIAISQQVNQANGEEVTMLVAEAPSQPQKLVVTVKELVAGFTTDQIAERLRPPRLAPEAQQPDDQVEHAGITAWRHITLAMAEEIHTHKNANARRATFPDGSSMPGAELTEPPWDPAQPCASCLNLARASFRVTMVHTYQAGFRLTQVPPSDVQIMAGLASITDLDRMKGLPYCYRRAFMQMVDVSIVPAPPAAPAAVETGGTDAGRGPSSNGHLA